MKSKIFDFLMYILLIAFSTYWMISEKLPSVYLGIYIVCVIVFLGFKIKKLKEHI